MHLETLINKLYKSSPITAEEKRNVDINIKLTKMQIAIRDNINKKNRRREKRKTIRTI